MGKISTSSLTQGDLSRLIGSGGASRTRDRKHAPRDRRMREEGHSGPDALDHFLRTVTKALSHVPQQRLMYTLVNSVEPAETIVVV